MEALILDLNEELVLFGLQKIHIQHRGKKGTKKKHKNQQREVQF